MIAMTKAWLVDDCLIGRLARNGHEKLHMKSICTRDICDYWTSVIVGDVPDLVYLTISGYVAPKRHV